MAIEFREENPRLRNPAMLMMCRLGKHLRGNMYSTNQGKGRND